MNCSVDSSRTAPVTCGVALARRRRLLRDHDRGGRKSEIEMRMQVGFFRNGPDDTCMTSDQRFFRRLLSAEYSFMGSLIIREVIKDLIPKGIKQAKVILLSGTR